MAVGPVMWLSSTKAEGLLQTPSSQQRQPLVSIRHGSH